MVELYNYLDDVSNKALYKGIKILEDERARSKLKERVLSVIDASIDAYTKEKHAIKSEQLEELVHIAMINDSRRYRRFLEAFL